MNDLDPNTKKEVDRLILVAIIALALFIGCSYMLDSYLMMAIIFILGVVLILYANGNETIHNFTNNCKWL